MNIDVLHKILKCFVLGCPWLSTESSILAQAPDRALCTIVSIQHCKHSIFLNIGMKLTKSNRYQFFFLHTN